MKMTNNAVATALAASLMISAFAAPGHAEERQFGYSIILTGVSDYLFRGISISNEKPAFQPYIEFTYGIAYVGIWGSNLGDRDLADAGFQVTGPWEVDYYAGLRPTLGPVNFDLGVLWYTYGARSNPGGLSKEDVDYVELKVAATAPLSKNLTVGLTGYYTPDQDVAIPDTGTIEGTVSYALPQVAIFSPTISGGVGYTTSGTTKFYGGANPGPFLGDDAYTYWNAGVKLTVEKWFFDFRYWATNIESPAALDSYERLGEDRFLFSAGIILP
jgi:uncharacterized protein (TIGR02001 family)